MKKILLILIAAVLFTPVFAKSYTNNQYQQQANAYNRMAEQAFDEGDYDKAVEYAKKAENYSVKSETYINTMVAKAEAQNQIRYAMNQLAWATDVDGEEHYPLTYAAGKQAYNSAQAAYKNGQYELAGEYAKAALEALGQIKEVIPLPKYYVVRPWAESKDCFWNISGRSYVYDNPALWENLYQANKSKLENPANPDLIHPGMIVEIPSIAGEYREGTYDSSVKYDVFSANR